MNIPLEEYEGNIISKDEVLAIHELVIAESDVKDDDGYIDGDGKLFDMAYHSMFAGGFGVDLYPTVEEKASILCYNIISNHCFANANKRTALHSLLTMLKMNNLELTCSKDDLFELITGVGEGTKNYEDILETVNNTKVEINSQGGKTR